MHQLLSQGVPSVVNNTQMHVTFDPNYFINKYYGNPCNIHYINTGKVEEMTMDQFFHTFGNLHPSEARVKLKVSLFSYLKFLHITLVVGLATRRAFLNHILGTI